MKTTMLVSRESIEEWTTWSGGDNSCLYITKLFGGGFAIGSNHAANERGRDGFPIIMVKERGFVSLVDTAKRLSVLFKDQPFVMEMIIGAELGYGTKAYCETAEDGLVAITFPSTGVRLKDTPEALETFLRGLADDAEREKMIQSGERTLVLV